MKNIPPTGQEKQADWQVSGQVVERVAEPVAELAGTAEHAEAVGAAARVEAVAPEEEVPAAGTAGVPTAVLRAVSPLV